MRCARLRFPFSGIRFRSSVLCLLFSALGFAGCRGRETPVEAGVRTQTLHLALGAEPRDLDPHILVAYNDMLVALALFEGLTAIDEKTSQPVPAVAERWESSPDGLTWTFHLRTGLKWSDGTPLTAEDFVASWQRALSPKLGSEYAYVLFALKNAEAFNAGRIADPASVGARAPDERTIEVTLERPTPFLAALTALPAWFPVPRHTIVKLGALDDRANPWTRRDPVVSNGPFVLKEWRPNQRIVTERNAQHYAAATTRLQSVVFYPMENAVAQEAAFRAGQLHLTYELPISKIAAYREREPEKLRTDPFLETAFLRFNTTKPPFNDARVRAAFARALDRRALVEHVTLGGQRPARA
ncbi:MAG TPA: peptide ABC transporter substrate-binding protein, partial [Opitutaceae bacterium]